jgi:hypothetical protein
MTVPRKRLPFDLPDRAVFELVIDSKEFASMADSEEIEMEAAKLLEEAYLENKHDLPDDDRMAIGIIHRWGLTASEQRRLEDVSAYTRQLTAQVYELTDHICEVTQKSVEEVQGAMIALQDSKYLPPYMRPFLEQILELQDKTPNYQERLTTIHLQRTMLNWTNEHTACLRPGIVNQLIKFAMAEEGIDPEPSPKSEPENS